MEKLKNMSFDPFVFSSYLISISLAVAVGIGSRRACLLLHDFYDYIGPKGKQWEMLEDKTSHTRMVTAINLTLLKYDLASPVIS